MNLAWTRLSQRYGTEEEDTDGKSGPKETLSNWNVPKAVPLCCCF